MNAQAQGAPVSDEHAMHEALREAEQAALAGEHPIGAVLVVSGEIVSRGRARHRERRSQVAHAELEALRQGGEALFARHDEATLYTTLEPCPMCLGAIVMADVPNVVFSLSDGLAGTGGAAMLEIPYVARHIARYEGGLLAEETRGLLERTAPRLLEVIS